MRKYRIAHTLHVSRNDEEAEMSKQAFHYEWLSFQPHLILMPYNEYIWASPTWFMEVKIKRHDIEIFTGRCSLTSISGYELVPRLYHPRRIDDTAESIDNQAKSDGIAGVAWNSSGTEKLKKRYRPFYAWITVKIRRYDVFCPGSFTMWKPAFKLREGQRPAPPSHWFL